ncbi:hypothetical protein BpHYR1_027630 [Brachionus plicatilis]|uniref:Uncharacterized protein n=1 Tax=Brachionus plicatilis TaxID=10195 RepID=A0A3M7PHV4_BRAPC|nr:hypothetical protein BpHYR1_027630 [Brachionus plicatilis]
MNENSSVDNSPVVTRGCNHEGKFADTTSIRNHLMAHDIRIESNSKETEIDEKQNEKYHLIRTKQIWQIRAF